MSYATHFTKISKKRAKRRIDKDKPVYVKSLVGSQKFLKADKNDLEQMSVFYKLETDNKW